VVPSNEQVLRLSGLVSREVTAAAARIEEHSAEGSPRSDRLG